MMSNRRRALRMVCAGLSFALLAACGSSLSDAEILARAGHKVSSGAAGALGTSGGATTAGGGTATTIVPGGTLDSSDGTAPGVGPVASGSGGDGSAGDPSAPVGDGGSSGGSASCKDSATGPIVIGNYGDYSGPAGASTVDIPNGIKIWAASLNAHGGLCGRQVQVVSADAGGDPARGASIAREQVEQDKAIAFISNSGLTSGSGASPYLIQHRIPVIGDSLADDAAKTSATIMSAYPTNAEAGLGSIRAAQRISGATQFGMMYCLESQLCGEIHTSFKAHAAEGGANWVWDAGVSLLQVDYTAECQGAQKAGVQILILMMDAASLLRIVRSCNRQGFKPTYVLIGNAITATTTQEPGFERSIILSLSFPFAGASSPAIDEYQQARQTYFANRPSNGGLASAWAAAKLFEVIATRAANTAGTINSETIVAAMQTVQDETANGLIPGVTWGAQGSHSKPCVFASQGDGSGGYLAPLGPDPIC